MNEETQAIQVLKEIAMEGLKEQRRARRWGIFFKLFFVGYLLLALGMMLGLGRGLESKSALSTADKVSAVVEVKGAIMDGAEASADLLIPSLRKAFENPKTKGVILKINSPGGSPVQAGYINDEIRRLKEQYQNIPVYAVVMDMCASGGYYIAVAADKIYADKASIVGSIGVRMDSFGAVDAMQKLGIERRLYTAGDNKGMLDPFLPENPAEVAHINSMLAVTHQQFIQVVKQGRGERLKNNPELFSGLFWTGETAVELGLIDGLGSESYVARELIGAETLVNFTAEKDLIQRLTEKVSLSMKMLLNYSMTLGWI
ncbi:protease-4 [Thiothrix eikelboomii]|uniref:Protease-4 n=1 Tax=Thiothrix eikelboomii TaxID=92487 RepID=A0A1T4WY71_9GAMM|nr:S49 family peptidase [Thiothrix eikelboomii]SKA82264.1 protease-4 [Thiothrix eikelboomii]